MSHARERLKAEILRQLRRDIIAMPDSGAVPRAARVVSVPPKKDA